MKTINTRRLELQPLGLKHASELFELFQDRKLYEFIERDPPETPEKFSEVVAWLEGRESKDQMKSYFDWIGVDHETKKIVCFIEITVYRDTQFCNLAYYVFEKYQRQGMAKEACAAVVAHLLKDLGVKKVIIEMDILNTASVRLAEALGATRVAFKPKFETIRGRWSDLYSYEINA